MLSVNNCNFSKKGSDRRRKCLAVCPNEAVNSDPSHGAFSAILLKHHISKALMFITKTPNKCRHIKANISRVLMDSSFVNC